MSDSAEVKKLKNRINVLQSEVMTLKAQLAKAGIKPKVGYASLDWAGMYRDGLDLDEMQANAGCTKATAISYFKKASESATREAKISRYRRFTRDGSFVGSRYWDGIDLHGLPIDVLEHFLEQGFGLEQAALNSASWHRMPKEIKDRFGVKASIIRKWNVPRRVDDLRMQRIRRKRRAQELPRPALENWIRAAMRSIEDSSTRYWADVFNETTADVKPWHPTNP